MIGRAPSSKYRHIVTICVLSFLLAIVWPAAAAAQGNFPGDTDTGLGNPGTVSAPTPTPGAPAPTSTPAPTPAPTPMPGGPAPTPTPGGSAPAASTDPTLAEPENRAALAPNGIVFHPATPVQLCKVGAGLQVYFIGADGSAHFGPWVPPFAELAATYPEGESASIYSGRNPLTGKQVDIDYLPAKHKLRVSTFYADRPPYAIDKPYVYTVDPIHNVTHEQW